MLFFVTASVPPQTSTRSGAGPGAKTSRSPPPAQPVSLAIVWPRVRSLRARTERGFCDQAIRVLNKPLTNYY